MDLCLLLQEKGLSTYLTLLFFILFFTFQTCLVICCLSINLHLISIARLISLTNCVFQDLCIRKRIGNAKEVDGLFLLDSDSDQDVQKGFQVAKLSSKEKNIWLWHYRLGLPSFLYLKFLFLELFKNKDISIFKCETCEFAKHHRSYFPAQVYI